MKVLTLVSLLAVAPFAVWSGIWAQDQATTIAPAAPAGSAFAPAQSSAGVATTVVQDHYYVPYGQNAIAVTNQHHQKHSELHAAYRKAFSEYQNAKDDEARRVAREALGDALDKQYDQFIESQATQIEELEERLSKLRAQLQKRKEAKSRMVELKLQMVLSQAEGLGFPEGNTISWGYGSFSSSDPFAAPGAVNMSTAPLFGLPNSAPLSPAELPATPVAPSQPEPATGRSSGGAR